MIQRASRRKGLWLAVFAMQAAFFLLQVPRALSRTAYGHDEGVYWQTLLNLSQGYALYSDIFYSQLPGFAYVTLLFADVSDPQIEAARLGCVFLASLLIPATAWVARQLGSPLWALLSAGVTALSSVVWMHLPRLAGNTPAAAFLTLALGCFLKASATDRFRWGWAVAGTLAMAFSLQLKAITVGGALIVVVLLIARLGRRAWLPVLACGALGTAVTLATLLAADPAGSLMTQLNGGALRPGAHAVPGLTGAAKLELFAGYAWAPGFGGNRLLMPLLLSLTLFVAWRIPERRRLLGFLWVSVAVASLPVFLYEGGRRHHFLAAVPFFILLLSLLLESLWRERARFPSLVWHAAMAFAALTLLNELRLDATAAVRFRDDAVPTALGRFVAREFTPGRDVVVGEAQFELAATGFTVPPDWADTSATRFMSHSLTCDTMLDRLSAGPIAGVVVGRYAEQVDCGRDDLERRLDLIFARRERVGEYVVFFGRRAHREAATESR